MNTRSIDPAKRVTTMPVPPGTTAADGYDAQIIVIIRATGDEWSASHFYHDATGYHAWNIGHYNTAWSGVPPYDANGNPFWIRGPGMTYLSGLIRPCEIAQGHIDHALAFAYPMTTPEFVYPATRSDGQQAPSSGMARARACSSTRRSRMPRSRAPGAERRLLHDRQDPASATRRR